MGRNYGTLISSRRCRILVIAKEWWEEVLLRWLKREDGMPTLVANS